MDKNLQIIIDNRDQAIKNLTMFDLNRETFSNAGFNEAQIDVLRKEANDAFGQTNSAFYEVFQFPIQVFDLWEGEMPNLDEFVYVYDELDGEWIRAEISHYPIDGEARFVNTNNLGVLGSPNNYGNYVRWARFPTLKAK